MARYSPLFSGSKGNCHFVGGAHGGILIDAGKNAKQIQLGLRQIDMEPDCIHAIFITHEHSDHISGLKVFAARYHIPVYPSMGTLDALSENCHLTSDYPARVMKLSGMEVGGMWVTAFRTSHDCREGLGFCVHTADDRKICFATDLGFISDEVRHALRGTDMTIIESNHDEKMLKTGGYPEFLKKRILSDVGHLSNRVCAGELPNLAKSGTSRFVLAHLSQENNLPQLALRAAEENLSASGFRCGIDYQLSVASQHAPQPVQLF